MVFILTIISQYKVIYREILLYIEILTNHYKKNNI